MSKILIIEDERKIARFLELANPPRQMIFMLQKEMGERLAAQPGKGSYGAWHEDC